jgi:histone H3
MTDVIDVIDVPKVGDVPDVLQLTNVRRQLDLASDDAARHPDDLADTDDEDAKADPMDAKEDSEATEDSDDEEDSDDDSEATDESEDASAIESDGWEDSESDGIRYEDNDEITDITDTDVEDANDANEAESGAKVTNAKAIADIRKLQATTDYLIPFSAFNRLVRQISENYKTDLRFTKGAILALQTATEDGLIDLLNVAQLMALHGGRTGVTPKDLQLALRAKDNPLFHKIL